MKNKKTNNRKQIKKSASKARTTSSASEKSVKSVETGIKILNYAIKKKISVSSAAEANDRGRNYVSDIKARIDKNYKNRSIGRDLYNSFKSTNRAYEATQR